MHYRVLSSYQFDMKILYAVECVNNTGGFDRIIIEKANYLAEYGHEVLIVVSYHGSTWF